MNLATKTSTFIFIILTLLASVKADDKLLIKNAMEGDLQQLKILLASPSVDINHTDPQKGTALHIAANNGDTAIATLLLSQGADLTAVMGKSQKSPMHIAAQEGHIDIVNLFLANEADLEIRDKKGETPIFSAILKNQIEVIEVLISSGADLSAISRFKDTPAYKAVSLGRVEATELLLEKNAPLSLDRVVEKKCAKCHGTDGRSQAPFSPNLAGMGENYLNNQFIDYQTGARIHPKMNSKLVNGISPTVLQKLSAYYSSQTPIQLDTDEASAARGKLLYENPHSEHGNCASCHGTDGVATQSDEPRLAGQNSEYLAIQLKAYRDEQRTNGEFEVMRAVTSNLSDEEISDIALFLQGL